MKRFSTIWQTMTFLANIYMYTYKCWWQYYENLIRVISVGKANLNVKRRHGVYRYNVHTHNSCTVVKELWCWSYMLYFSSIILAMCCEYVFYETYALLGKTFCFRKRNQQKILVKPYFWKCWEWKQHKHF